jgi:thioesterase domain-containing protein
VLAGWGLLTAKLREHGVEGELVIQDSRVSYLTPVTGDFSARAVLPTGPELERFLRAVDRYRKGRVRLHVTIEHAGREAVRFEAPSLCWVDGKAVPDFSFVSFEVVACD